jgi:hypothetical protein
MELTCGGHWVKRTNVSSLTNSRSQTRADGDIVDIKTLSTSSAGLSDRHDAMIRAIELLVNYFSA